MAKEQDIHEDILLKIALRGSRCDASLPCSGLGLCLAGVGYDLTDLAVDKVKAKSLRHAANTNETNKKSRIGIPETGEENI